MKSSIYIRIALVYLLVYAFLYFLLSSFYGRQSTSQVAGMVQKKVNGLIQNAFTGQESFLELLKTSTSGIDYSQLPKQENIELLIYRNGTLVFWNGNKISPPDELMRGGEPVRVYEEGGNKFILISKVYVTPFNSYKVVQAIHLYSRLPISNRYVRTGPDEAVFGPLKFYIGYSQAEDFYPVKYKDKVLFYVYSLNSGTEVLSNEQLLLQLLVFWLISFLFTAALFFAFRKGNDKPVVKALVLVLVLLSIRIGMLANGFPSAYVTWPAFDSRFFASSFINPTFGDLLINLLIALILLRFLFNRSKQFSSPGYWFGGSFWPSISLQVLAMMIPLAGGWLGYDILYSIAKNSAAVNDVTMSLTITPLRIMMKLTFLPVAYLFFLCLQISGHLQDRIKPMARKQFLYGALVLIICLVGLLTQRMEWIIVLVVISVVMFLSANFKMHRETSTLNFRSYVYYTMVVLCISAFGGLAHTLATLERERFDKKKFGETLLSENDIITEFYLNDARNSIRKDAYIINRFLYPLVRKDLIEGKIKRVHLPSYFSKYDFHLSLFDPSGNPFPENEIQENYFQYRSRLVKGDNSTDFEDVYYINYLGRQQLRKFYCCIPISTRNLSLGYMIMELRVGTSAEYSVYPELLIDERFGSLSKSSSFSFAVFQNEGLAWVSGEFQKASWLTKELLSSPVFYELGIVKDDQHYLAVKGPQNKVVVITSRYGLWNSFYSNFSFYLFNAVLILFLLLLVGWLYYYSRGLPFNFSTRIQLYLNLYFLLPSIILSVFIIGIIAKGYQEELISSFQKRAEVIASDFESSLQDYLDGQSNVGKLENELTQISNYNSCDINLYSTSGRLLISTEPLLIKYGLNSSLINPLAYFNIFSNGLPSITMKERIGRLNYYAVYLPLRSTQNNTILGIISIPFFEASDEYERELIRVVNSVLNLFAGIFLLFALTSFFITSNLLQPLRLIGGTLRKTSLEGKNLPLDWPVKDEIGKLVEEYNRMISNLDESKKLLARTEKESAWREMAQQVAHEIKNPLTPMKLKLQTLQRQAAMGDPAFNDRAKDTIALLLEQIDNLANIASSFYDFARMPTPVLEPFDLVQVAHNTVSLHNNTERQFVAFNSNREQCIVNGDEKLMGQIISNLIINALQSIPTGRVPKIAVSINGDKGRLVLTVEDNGSGIPENIRDKVFLPNFSTKYYGSGIGLALAKRGVESAGGSIYFKTREDLGTTFFIELPLGQ